MTREMEPRVLVMLAAYNGAANLERQVETILAQEGVQVTLRICDDRSTDGTFELCERLAREDARIIATQNGTNKGPGENFMQMVYEDDAVGYDLFAFSDQDDEWHPRKLAIAAEEIEAQGPGVPTLFFSDITNFDGEREWPEIARFASLEEHPRTLLLRNWVNGCAMVFNRELLDLLRQCRPSSWPRLHDTWVHMAARFCGNVIPRYDLSLSRRRIHASQTVGETRPSFASPGEAISAARNLLRPAEHVFSETASMFLEAYAPLMREEDVRFFELVVAARSSASARARLAASGEIALPTHQADVLMRLGALLNRY